MQESYPVTRDIVLIGGGHTHALVLRRWGMVPLPGVRLTLISPEPTSPYTGMLPGHVAGHYSREELDIDLMRLTRFAGARMVRAPMLSMDAEARLVHVDGRPPVAFDIASVNIGIHSALPDTSDPEGLAIAAKPLGPFATRWARFVEERGTETGARVVFVGGGIGGVELALAARYRLPEAEITVVDAGTALGDTSARAARSLRAALRRNGIALHEQTGPAEITSKGVEAGARTLPADLVVTVAGAQPPDALGKLGLPLHDGYVEVDRFLRSTGAKHVFAAGDCAHMRDSPRVKAGVYAVRQAPALFDNLRAAAMGRGLKPYRAQRDYLKLVSVGAGHAVADWKGLAPSGAPLWYWKDRIDRAFMAKLTELPPMNASSAVPKEAASGVRALVQAQPLCGGCGAKVAAGVLREAVATLPPPLREDVARGAGDDAALLKTSRGFQALSTDHFRAFIEDPYLLTRIAALHAMGDIWAMGGLPQAALSQLILPRMGEVPQARLMTEVTAAASETFREAGADLVGGHSSLGAELTVGFAVTGLVERPITVNGARPGDALILTKPIGTGTILAADMRHEAPGMVVAKALDSMAESSATAARLLAPHAHAMTDVTGFGLAGHLLTLLDGGGLGARLTDLPILEGAEALSSAGYRSSLFAHNRARAGLVTGAEGPLNDLIFDPQTAGGLLAAVAADEAETLVSRIGGAARIIGFVTEGPVAIRLDL